MALDGERVRRPIAKGPRSRRRRSVRTGPPGPENASRGLSVPAFPAHGRAWDLGPAVGGRSSRDPARSTGHYRRVVRCPRPGPAGREDEWTPHPTARSSGSRPCGARPGRTARAGAGPPVRSTPAGDARAAIRLDLGGGVRRLPRRPDGPTAGDRADGRRRDRRPDVPRTARRGSGAASTGRGPRGRRRHPRLPGAVGSGGASCSSGSPGGGTWWSISARSPLIAALAQVAAGDDAFARAVRRGRHRLGRGRRGPGLAGDRPRCRHRGHAARVRARGPPSAEWVGCWRGQRSRRRVRLASPLAGTVPAPCSRAPGWVAVPRRSRSAVRPREPVPGRSTGGK